MKLRKLITTKPHKYGTRHLTAGEEYEVPPRHAIALVAGRKARFADVRKVEKPRPVAVPQPEPEPPQPAHAVGATTSDATIDHLRLQATQLGIDVDGRWAAPRLRHEIEIAQAKR
jgi:hypothetical protein